MGPQSVGGSGSSAPRAEDEEQAAIPTATAHHSCYLPWLPSEYKPPAQQLQPSVPPFSLPGEGKTKLCQASGPEEDKGVKRQHTFQKSEKCSEG